VKKYICSWCGNSNWNRLSQSVFYYDHNIDLDNELWICDKCQLKENIINIADFCNDIQSAYETLKLFRSLDMITKSEYIKQSDKYVKQIKTRLNKQIKNYSSE